MKKLPGVLKAEAFWIIFNMFSDAWNIKSVNLFFVFQLCRFYTKVCFCYASGVNLDASSSNSTVQSSDVLVFFTSFIR